MARAGIAVTRQMTLHFQYSLARFPTPAQLAHSSGAMRKIPRQTHYTRRTRPVAMLTIDTSEKKDVADHALLGSGILDRVGNTPLIRIEGLSAQLGGIQILGKAEWANPGGSVKDRAARAIVLDALKNGLLGPDKKKHLLDATSGNTGIAYAMLGAALGFPVTLIMPSNVSPERKRILAAYEAKILWSDPAEGTDGAIRNARELAANEPEKYWYADQYSNDNNWRAHYETTANEIWRQTDGRVTHFLAGLGTSGTFVGTTRRLKELNPRIQCISLEPDSPFNGLEGLKHMETAILPH